MPTSTTRFRCNYTGCARSYKNKEHLLRHKRDHLNLRLYACQGCSAKFNRSDLLKRHQAISHQAEDTILPVRQDEETPLAHVVKLGQGQQAPESESSHSTPSTSDDPLDARLAGLNLSSTPTMRLLEVSDRTELQDSYFQNFHPHWPLLHTETYLKSDQSPELTSAVLTAGLWVLGTPESRDRARFYHNALLSVLDAQLFKFIKSSNTPLRPRAEFLAQFQVLLIALILTTYRGAETFPSAIISNKYVFQLFKMAGVFEQEAINAQRTNPIIRECYQRLALLHFKAHIHLNSLLTTQFPLFKPFEYLVPNILKVELPSSSLAWDGNEVISSRMGGSTELVADLFDQHAHPLAFNRIAPLVAWDFSLGMAAGCYLVGSDGEEHLQLLQRQRQFLFLHLKVPLLPD